MSTTPIPVEAARQVALHFSKSIIVILAHDSTFEQMHCVTYGRSAEDKEIAAIWGELCVAHLGSGETRATYEDFRTTDQAKRAEAIELLTHACKAAEHALRSVLASREGITDQLLSNVADTCAEAIRARGGK